MGGKNQNLKTIWEKSTEAWHRGPDTMCTSSVLEMASMEAPRHVTNRQLTREAPEPASVQTTLDRSGAARKEG